MSYILDALKRAETEKNQRILPIQQSEMGETPRNTHAPKITRRAVIECVLVLVFLTAVGTYFMTTQETPKKSSLKSTFLVSASPRPKQPQPNHAPNQSFPQNKNEKVVPPFAKGGIGGILQTSNPKIPLNPPFTKGEVKEQAPEPELKEEPEIPQLIEMPESFQQSIPPLQFKGHFYSTDPPKGSVMIEDKVYAVGGEIAPGITLETVTRTGIILNARGARFRIEVLGNWVY